MARVATWVVLTAGVLAAGACARSNARDPDANLPDGGPDTDCRSETCNGRDDDCDGTTDEDAHAECATPGYEGHCVAGYCLHECARERGDCDGDRANGCELTVTEDRDNCGECGRRCGVTELCEAGSCRREHIVDFGAGENVCVVVESGRVLCWGPGDAGGNGDGTTEDRDEPVEVVGVRDAVQISTGTSSCAVTRPGDVWCWGWNESGVVSYPPSDWEPPTRRAEVHDAREVNVSADGCVRLAPDDSVACWGHRTQGEPDYSLDIAPLAEPVPGLHARGLSDTRGYHRYAVTLTGTVVMWGTDGHARDFIDPTRIWPPQPIESAPGDLVAFTGGVNWQCAVLADGSARCRSVNFPWTTHPLTDVRFAIEGPERLALADGALWEWDNVYESLPPLPFQNLRRVELPAEVVRFRDLARRCVQFPGDRLGCWHAGDSAPLRWIPGFE